MPVEMELQVVAKLLRQGRTLDRLSNGLTLLALSLSLALPLLIRPTPYATVLLAALVLIGLAQKYWAVRVALDAELFALLATETQALGARTEALDHALMTLGLQPAAKAGRAWPERCSGALRLLRIQAILLIAQVLLALGGSNLLSWLAITGQGAVHA